MREAAKLSLKELFFIFAAIMLVVGNSGIWAMPNIVMQFMVSQSLFKVPFDDPNAHYLFFNYFQPFLYGLTGAKSLTGYLIYSFCIAAVFLLLFLFWFISYHGKKVSIEQNKLFAAVTFPVFMIPFYWVGMDGMTLLLSLLILISRDKIPLALIFAFMLGLQHFEQGFIAFSTLLATLLIHYLFSKDKTSLVFMKKVFFILASIAVAKVLLMLFFYFANVGLSGDRGSYLKTNLYLYFEMFQKWWFVTLWTLFATGWLLISQNLKTAWPLIFATLIILILTVIVGDQTRVGVIVLFPSLFYWIFMNREIWQKLTQKMVILMLSFYLLVPIVVVWGEPHIQSLWKYDKQIAKEIYDDNLKLEEVDWLVPFKDKTAAISKPLTDFKVKISTEITELVCSKQTQCTFSVNVKNNSSDSWYSKGANSVNLSYHITTQDAKVILLDGTRTSLPHEIAGGVSAPLLINVNTNLETGSYILEVDMVQEGVAWFGQKDKQNLLRIPLKIK
ncbi:MAG: hypothetical protein WC272_04965 [Sulfurimonas sp.]